VRGGRTCDTLDFYNFVFAELDACRCQNTLMFTFAEVDAAMIAEFRSVQVRAELVRKEF
jgi:hypothetical protein